MPKISREDLAFLQHMSQRRAELMQFVRQAESDPEADRTLQTVEASVMSMKRLMPEFPEPLNLLVHLQANLIEYALGDIIERLDSEKTIDHSGE